MQPHGKRKTPMRRVAFWLAQAEHHIEHRRFYLARRILEAIHDPDAYALLEDLNAIAPLPSAPTCPICGAQEFTWHRTVSNVTFSQQIQYVEVDRKEVFSRVCASCSNVQMFLQLPEWAQLD